MSLSIIIFIPAVVALILACFPKDSGDNLFRFGALAGTLAVLFAVVAAFFFPGKMAFDPSVAGLQDVQLFSWVGSKAFTIDYFMGVDGISFPLIVLTAGVSVLAMIASWSITKQVKGFCILFLLLETGMLGVFLALDFFLFYIFWEVMLLPMYFLIGIWGGPRKEYAAIKFFLYTLFGSVLMLIAILMIYFASDLNTLSEETLISTHVVKTIAGAEGAITADGDSMKALVDRGYGDADKKVHTFNIMALAAMARNADGQSADIFGAELLFGWKLQHWAFLLLFIGFAIKVPSFPVHTWLPDAHVEAPTPISMILAGILLKMGGYGILRICYPICPEGGYDFRWFVCGIGVVSMVYGAFAALAQKDFKRMVAYSSVSHMGYVVLGLGVWSAAAGNNYAWEYWDMGIKGAMYQMIAHGVSSAGMFFMVGVVYDRVHHRDLNKFGGLYGKMPLYSALAFAIFFAGLGLPGLCGFIGEVFVVLSVWNFSQLLAIISAFVVILTAAYILWALQRVYLGAEYKGPHEEDLKPINSRELCVAIPLVFLAILFGVYPKLILRYMDATIDQQAQTLTDLVRVYEAEDDRIAAEKEAEDSAGEAGAAAAARFYLPPAVAIPKVIEDETPDPVGLPIQRNGEEVIRNFNNPVDVPNYGNADANKIAATTNQ